jgi:subtilisin family serine protease
MDRHEGAHGRADSRWRHLALAFFLSAAVLAVALVLSATLLRSSSARAVGHAALPRPSRSHATPFRPGAILIGFRAGVSAQERDAIARAAGGAEPRRLGPAIKAAGHGRVAGEEYLAPYEMSVPVSREHAVLARLRHTRRVAYAEPDYLMSATATPNDPSFAQQWGDSNTGQAIPVQEINENLGAPASGTPGADDGALKAWQFSTGSRSIVIGETDTGVDYTHPDLAANIWSNPGNIGGCAGGTHGYNVLAKTCNPMDEDTSYGGHGTHVAGILGAVANNKVGVAGMNWQTTILPVRWMNDASSGETGALIEALQWLVAAKQAGVNIRVENDSDTFFGTAYSQALSNEIDVLGANNILFVASAGNSGNNNDETAVQRYPCSYDRPNEICVASTDNNDQLPSWANYGPHTVDLAAPGVSIFSTLRGGTYGYLSGSSMAAPQVAGAAALVLSVAPSLSATALKADILEHVDHLPSLAGRVITGGRLDVCKALPGCAVPTEPRPNSTSAPAINGTAQQGQTLTELHGSWTNEPTSFAYQWQRCNSSGASCSPIPGANAQSYVPVGGDVGHTLRVSETASNLGGASSPATSAASAPVVKSAPINSGLPKISGTAAVGQTLSANTGNWSEHPTAYAYQWLRCDSNGANCAPIASATAATYIAAEADAGSTLRVAVTASNAAGPSAPSTSNQTPVIATAPPSAPPANTGAPKITGTATVGQTLSASTGNWTEHPTAYAYQWRRCDTKGNNCAAIELATTSSYTLVQGDGGNTLRVSVTASNALGASAPAASSPTPVVNWQSPANVTPPSISGTALSGQTLTATPGAWSGVPASYSYQWQRCEASGNNCKALSATETTYTLGEGDVGSTLRVAVTASNPAGHQTVTSAPTETVTATAQQIPTNSYAPVITGNARQEQTLTEIHGSWTGEPTSFAYQWLRCDTSGASCVEISGATAQTYVPQVADTGHTLAVSEIAKNSSGSSAPAISGTTAAVAPPAPVNTAPPTIAGSPRQGQPLNESHGAWTNEPTSFFYQWLRCEASGANCQPIAGASGQAYVPGAEDVGHALEVSETASNAGGSGAPASSAPTGVVAAGATATFGKSTVGALHDGGILANYKVVHTAVLSAPGAISKLSVYAVPGVNSPAPQVLKGVIYADGGGSPGALVATGAEAVYRGNVNGVGWFELPFASAVPLNAGTYWIGFITGATTDAVGYAYDEAPNSRAFNQNPFSSGPSDPFGPATEDSEQASIYATYVPSGSSRPVNGTAPSISGTAQQGQTLTDVPGTWSGEPTSFAYQWLRCESSGSGCAEISGATLNTYVANEADVGHTLKVSETASNEFGTSAPESSAPTGVVQPATAATFGKTAVGASSDYFLSERKRVNKYALPTPGSITKLSIYLTPTGTSGQQVIKGIIYADSGGKPAALLGVSEEFTFKSSNSAGWYDLSLASPLKLAAGNYWIGVMTGATGGIAGFRFDSVSGARDYNANTYASGPSDPFGTFSSDAEQTSLYATYIPG